MNRIPAPELEELLTAIYVGHGVPDEEARVVAGLQVEANLVGHDSHGLNNTERYLRDLARGHIRPGAPIDVVAETDTTLQIDGHWGFGFTVTSAIVDRIAEKALRSGTCAVTVRRQGHVGRLGAYTSRLAERNLIAIATADSGNAPKCAAPFGGSERRLGSNPISIAVPTRSHGVVCLDMATTSAAVGKLMLAQLRGEEVPDGWLVTADGKPSNTPSDYFDGGALLPFGGTEGHKGYGLSFMIEVLSGLLTGIGFGVDPSGRHNDGCFIAAFAIERFRPLAEFLDEMDDFIDFIKSSDRAEGFDEILYPGEIEARTREERLRDGIPLDEQILDFLRAQATELRIASPLGAAAS